MFDVIALGELLIDFTLHSESENGMRLFEQNPGGAPANVLCALANLGLRTAFAGKVGQDMHGDFLRATLEEKGVGTGMLISSPDVFTTLAFVKLSETGEREFSFARKPGADTQLTPQEVAGIPWEDCRIFHFGSLSLTDEPARTATLEAVQAAKRAGCIISCDPNYRAPLWRGEADAAQQIRSVLGLVDIIKISDEEMGLITGSSSLEGAAAYMLGAGISCAVITLGNKGAYVATKADSALVPVPAVPVVDATGAGDAFWGGFLYKLVESGLRPEQLGKDELMQSAVFANAVASLCVQKRGGIPAMPTLAEVLESMRQA
ncbi:MAG: carbohydrate kinase [Clostridiales Family XIII bacterium]|jgi:fructokinase|nr:carbohydrate kinase [Clostridiales Family XIII bacterium]